MRKPRTVQKEGYVSKCWSKEGSDPSNFLEEVSVGWNLKGEVAFKHVAACEIRLLMQSH
jgi:hypothetical protein